MAHPATRTRIRSSDGTAGLEMSVIERCRGLRLSGDRATPTGLEPELEDALLSEDEFVACYAMREGADTVLKAFPHQHAGEAASMAAERARLLRGLWTKAVTEAKAEGQIWTPRIDSFSDGFAGSKKRPGQGEGAKQMAEVKDALRRQVDAQIVTLLSMMAGATWDELIQALAGTESSVLWETAAKTFKAIPPDALETAAKLAPNAKCLASLVTGILENPETREDVIYRVLLKETETGRLAAESLNRHLYSSSDTCTGVLQERFGHISSETARRLIANLGKKPDRNDSYFQDLMEMAAKRPDADAQLLEEMWDPANGYGKQARGAALLNKHFDTRRIAMIEGLSWLDQRDVLTTLAQSPEITSDVVRWLIDTPHDQIRNITFFLLVLNPSIDTDTAVEIGLKHSPARGGLATMGDVREALIRRADTRYDPRLADILQKSTSSNIAEEWVEYAQTTEDLERAALNILKRKDDKQRSTVLTTLLRREIPHGLRLSRQILSKAMAQGNETTRKLAMEVMRRWNESGNLETEAQAHERAAHKPKKRA